jgi:membrane associated rhomboid family serine protease
VGRLRFGLIYFVSLLAGSFGALLLEPDSPTVGASGAIFGLMAAAAVVLRNRGLSIWESGLGIWIGLNLLITFTVPNISIGGHVGGLIGGGVCAVVLFDLRDRVRLPDAVPAALCAGLGALAVVGSIAVAG